jgi:uncharacterized protein (DUF1330 family)
MSHPAYFIFNVTAVHDAEGMKPYQEKVRATVAAYYGTLLIGGGEVETIEGAPAQGKFFVLRFESMAAAKAWYQSPDYQAIVGHRHAASSCDAVLLEGLPL